MAEAEAPEVPAPQHHEVDPRYINHVLMDQLAQANQKNILLNALVLEQQDTIRQQQEVIDGLAAATPNREQRRAEGKASGKGKADQGLPGATPPVGAARNGSKSRKRK